MIRTSCRLGAYTVKLIRGGNELTFAGAKPSYIRYGRLRNGISTAQARFITVGKGDEDCCGKLKYVDAWNTDMVVTVDGTVGLGNPSGKPIVVWSGPVRKVRYGRGYVQVDATDILAFLQVRDLLNNLTFTNLDLVDIFVGIWNDAIVPYSPTKHELIRYPTGITESRIIEGSAARAAWNVATEMLGAGLDISTFGTRVILGMPPSPVINLSDTDVIGDVYVEKDGDSFGNRWIANAAKDVVGIYPPGPRGQQGLNGYPLVERNIADTQLPDQASADTAAKAHYDFAGHGVLRVRADGELTLLPSSNIDADRLMMGQLVSFAATETCYTARSTLAIGSITTTVEKKQVTSVITLEPTGLASEDVGTL